MHERSSGPLPFRDIEQEFFSALSRRDKRTVRLILESHTDDLDLDIFNPEWGCRPIVFAAQTGCPEIMQMVLDAGASVNFSKSFVFTAI